MKRPRSQAQDWAPGKPVAESKPRPACQHNTRKCKVNLRAKSSQWQARLLLYPAGHVQGTEAGPGASIKNHART